MNIHSIDSIGTGQTSYSYSNKVSFKSENGDALKKVYNSLTLKEKLALGGAVLASAPFVVGGIAAESVKESAENANKKFQQVKQDVSDKVERYIDKKVNNFIDKYFK